MDCDVQGSLRSMLRWDPFCIEYLHLFATSREMPCWILTPTKRELEAFWEDPLIATCQIHIVRICTLEVPESRVVGIPGVERPEGFPLSWGNAPLSRKVGCDIHTHAHAQDSLYNIFV